MGHRQHADTPATAEASERYRAARERYEVAKYEYKAAKYALKAARMRARSGDDAGPRTLGVHGHDQQGRERHERNDERGKHGERGEHGEHGRRRQVVLEVLATQRIGEHLARLTLGGPGFADFRDNHFTDKYVKILFVDPALGLEPPYDVQALRRQLPKHQRPVRRTYTVHSVDARAQSLVIDVVLHGDTGMAGPWAARARVGEKVAFAGPGGKYAPDAAADAHLFVADASALPAVSAALADLAVRAPAAVGKAVLEVAGPEDEWELTAPAGVDVRWLHHGGDTSPEASGLAAAVEAIGSDQWPAGRVHAFVHGEKAMVRRLRRHLTEDRGVDRRMLSLSSYWTHGKDRD